MNTECIIVNGATLIGDIASFVGLYGIADRAYALSYSMKAACRNSEIGM